MECHRCWKGAQALRELHRVLKARQRPASPQEDQPAMDMVAVCCDPAASVPSTTVKLNMGVTCGSSPCHTFFHWSTWRLGTTGGRFRDRKIILHKSIADSHVCRSAQKMSAAGDTEDFTCLNLLRKSSIANMRWATKSGAKEQFHRQGCSQKRLHTQICVDGHDSNWLTPSLAQADTVIATCSETRPFRPRVVPDEKPDGFMPW